MNSGRFLEGPGPEEVLGENQKEVLNQLAGCPVSLPTDEETEAQMGKDPRSCTGSEWGGQDLPAH